MLSLVYTLLKSKIFIKRKFFDGEKFFYEESSRVQKDKKDFASLSEIKRFGGRRGERTVVVVVLLLVVVAMIPQEYSCLNKFHKFPFGYYTCFNYKESINYNFYNNNNNNNNNNNSIGVGITFNSQKFKGFSFLIENSIISPTLSSIVSSPSAVIICVGFLTELYLTHVSFACLLI